MSTAHLLHVNILKIASHVFLVQKNLMPEVYNENVSSSTVASCLDSAKCLNDLTSLARQSRS